MRIWPRLFGKRKAQATKSTRVQRDSVHNHSEQPYGSLHMMFRTFARSKAISRLCLCENVQGNECGA